MSIISREQLLAVDDLEKETVEVKQWGGAVIVSEMTGVERAEFDELLEKEGGGEKTIPVLLLFALRDANGDRLFQSVEEVQKRSWRTTSKLFDIAARVNRIRTADVEKQEKN